MAQTKAQRQATLAVRKLESKKMWSSIEFIIFSYVLLIGFFQFIAVFFGSEVSLQSAIVLPIIGIVIYMYFNFLRAGAGRGWGILFMIKAPYLLTWLVLFGLLIWTAFWGKNILPEMFSIALP